MTFSSDVKRFSDNAKKRMDAQVRAISLDLYTSVILGSPVGNPTLWKHPAPKGYAGGSFRNSWYLSMTTPSDGAGRAPNKGGADSLRDLDGLPHAGGVTMLTNNLPYGIRLEYEGWSK